MKLRLVLGAVAVAGALAIVQGGLVAQAPAQGRGQGGGAAQPQGRGQGAAAPAAPAPPQGRGQAAPPPPPPPAQQAALIDLTGNWVSVVDLDWRFRMMTPPKGDYAQVPLNAASRKIADTFDPAQYGGTNYQTSQIIDCRAYGAAGLMHMPMRLRITWDSPDTLKIETDWGQQTRLLHFTPGRPFGDVEVALRTGDVASHGPASMQGYSVAAWEQPFRFNAMNYQRANVGRGGGLGQNRADELQTGGNLGVITTDLAPGWLRRNGVPYSSKTRLVEHFMRFQDPTGKDWFTVTTEVIDPEYLNTPFYTSAEFQKEPDASKWAPHPCKSVGQ